MGENLKLSEASQLCGISVQVLKLLIADGLLPQTVRTAQGHAYLPSDAVPTWQECRALVEAQRDRHLKRVADLVSRVQIQLEAVRNDVSQAREHPTDELGVDLLSAGTFGRSERSTLPTAMHQLDLARMRFETYHAALREIVERDML
jgi:DNA-binding transcriptional MerR regulator